MTPRGKTDKMMRNLRLKYKNKLTEHVRKQLLMSNVVTHEIDNKVKVANPKLKRSIYGK